MCEVVEVTETVPPFRNFYRPGCDVTAMPVLSDRLGILRAAGNFHAGQGNVWSEPALVGATEQSFQDELTTNTAPQARLKLWEATGGFQRCAGPRLRTRHTNEVSRLHGSAGVMMLLE